MLPVKVFNEGISGYQSKQQFNLLFNAVLPRVRDDIDMVVSVDGVNDFLSYVSNRKKNQISISYNYEHERNRNGINRARIFG